jgi:hypothetical protein
MSNTITLTFEVPEALCRDIIITACEGGIGYWSVLKEYDGPAIDDNEPGALPLYVAETDDRGEPDGPWRQLDVNAVGRGIQVLLQDYPQSVAARNITAAVIGYESGNYDFDAGDADMVVQCALLGEVRYG